MVHVVQIKGEHAVFPVNACVHCLRPAVRDIEIIKVQGYAVRKLRVPFCDDCIALRQARSRRQILFERFAIVNSVLLALAVGVRVYTSVSPEAAFQREQGWIWGLLLGALAALIVFGLMYLIIQPWAGRFRSPETQAALKAVTIKEFDWETTTLAFANEEYGARFAQVNPPPGK